MCTQNLIVAELPSEIWDSFMNALTVKDLQMHMVDRELTPKWVVRWLSEGDSVSPIQYDDVHSAGQSFNLKLKHDQNTTSQAS